MDYFIPDSTYDDAIANKEVGVLRALLVGILAGDPTFATTEFEEAKNYVEEKGIKVEESYTKLEGEYTSEESEWNEKYYQMQLVWMEDNFSEKRMEEIKKIGRVVYENKDTLGKIKRANKVQNNKAKGLIKQNAKTNQKKTDSTPRPLQKFRLMLQKPLQKLLQKLLQNKNLIIVFVIIVLVIIVSVIVGCKLILRRG